MAFIFCLPLKHFLELKIEPLAHGKAPRNGNLIFAFEDQNFDGIRILNKVLPDVVNQLTCAVLWHVQQSTIGLGYRFLQTCVNNILPTDIFQVE